jgi:DNA-binding GntR family transcriptional regulator
MSSIEPIDGRESLTSRARDAIRSAIIVGKLVPGTLYSVQGLADVFGVSRTPVREALIDLARQGMVRFERNRGVRILETSTHDLEEIFTLRLLLEVPATYRATSQLNDAQIRQLKKEFAAMETHAARDDETAVMQHDRRFHGIILTASGNRRLSEFVDHLRDLVLTRGASTVGRSRSLADVASEHREILACIEAGDGPAAARTMRAHIIRTGSLLIEQEGGDPHALEASWTGLIDQSTST